MNQSDHHNAERNFCTITHITHNHQQTKDLVLFVFDSLRAPGTAAGGLDGDFLQGRLVVQVVQSLATLRDVLP